MIPSIGSVLYAWIWGYHKEYLEGDTHMAYLVVYMRIYTILAKVSVNICCLSKFDIRRSKCKSRRQTTGTK